MDCVSLLWKLTLVCGRNLVSRLYCVHYLGCFTWGAVIFGETIVEHAWLMDVVENAYYPRKLPLTMAELFIMLNCFFTTCKYILLWDSPSSPQWRVNQKYLINAFIGRSCFRLTGTSILGALKKNLIPFYTFIKCRFWPGVFNAVIYF